MRPVWLIEAGVYGAEADPLLAEIRQQGMVIRPADPAAPPLGPGCLVRGKPRPEGLMEALAANFGGKLSDESRRKMSEAHKRRRTRQPAAGEPWTTDEDELARKGFWPRRRQPEQVGRSGRLQPSCRSGPS